MSVNVARLYNLQPDGLGSLGRRWCKDGCQSQGGKNSLYHHFRNFLQKYKELFESPNVFRVFGTLIAVFK